MIDVSVSKHFFILCSGVFVKMSDRVWEQVIFGTVLHALSKYVRDVAVAFYNYR